MESTTRVTRARALLLVLAVLLAGATPVAAAPGPGADEAPPQVGAVLSWLFDWVPGLQASSPEGPVRGAGSEPAAIRAGARGDVSDGPEQFGGASPDGSFETTADDPSEDPERGGVLDPNG